MKKINWEKVLETIGTIIISAFGFFILYFGFRFLWEIAKAIFK
jgi:hypothetical protein